MGQAKLRGPREARVAEAKLRKAEDELAARLLRAVPPEDAPAAMAALPREARIRAMERERVRALRQASAQRVAGPAVNRRLISAGLSAALAALAVTLNPPMEKPDDKAD